MRKLLTILGTVGLTATTGAAVVSCADKNVDKKNDIEAVLQNENITMAEETGVIIRNFNVLIKTLHNFRVVTDNKEQEIINFSSRPDSGLIALEPIGTGSVTFHIEADVRATAQDAKPEVKVSKNMTISVQKANLADIKTVIIETDGAGISKEEVEDRILSEIQHRYVSKTTKNDYTVKYTSESPELVKIGDKITITAKTDSKYFFGELEITIIARRITIYDIKITGIKAGTSRTDIEARTLKEVRTIVPEVTENDYIFYNLNDSVKVGDKITVQANETSIWIVGYFQIEITE